MTDAGPVFGTQDAMFDHAYVDLDEWRDEPVRHRYIHGGFTGTDARFSLYFPPAERYQGRFFHPLMAISGTEHGATAGLHTGGTIEFAVASGAYLVESNQGRLDPFPGDDPTIPGFRTSAAVARYSRLVAAEMYGAHRSFGYVYGGSGGAFKTMSCVENELGVWDGSVPYVHGTPMSIPHMFTVQNHAMRILHDRFPDIVDAVEPGGSGDMFAGLTTEQREALVEVTRMGFPPRAWFDVERIARGYHGVWSMLFGNVVKQDPGYFRDFWTVPGYLGADPGGSLLQARVQLKTTVSRTVLPEEAAALGLQLPFFYSVGMASEVPVALRIDGLPDASLQGATLSVTSGAAAGRKLSVVSVTGDIVVTGFSASHAGGLSGVQAGDEVQIDNSDYLASQTYHRHCVDADFPQWDQFQVAGRPIYPQRSEGSWTAGNGTGRVQTGRFAGKMIVIENLLDEAAYPCQADWYRRKVEAALGSRLDDHYRLWLIDHAMHTTPTVGADDPRPVRTTRVISYQGILQQAIRDLADWVEKGVAPPPSTEYELIEGQVFVPPTAKARRGIQAVVSLTANGGSRAEVAVGETVEFVASVEVPPGAGTIVAAEWDFLGAGDYPVTEPKPQGEGRVLSRTVVRRSYAFDAPGTYFPVLRVTSQRQGDPDTPYGRVFNLGRVRVVVR